MLLQLQACSTIAAADLWNDLPQHIREAPSLSTFKTRLKPMFTPWCMKQYEPDLIVLHLILMIIF